MSNTCPRKPTQEQLDYFKKYYEEEILVMEAAIYDGLSEEERKDKANYTWQWCPAYYDRNKEPEKSLTPNQGKYFFSPWEALKYKNGHGQAYPWFGAIPPKGYIYLDHDKPSELYDKQIESAHGHRSKKKHCGHILHKTKLKPEEMSAATYEFESLGFVGEICGFGIRPIWVPGTAKGVDQVITHRRNHNTSLSLLNEELEEQIRRRSEIRSVQLTKNSKKTFRIIQDWEGFQLNEGGRNYFLAVSVGRYLRDLGINYEDMSSVLDFANHQFCNPPVEEGKIKNIYKQMEKEAKDLNLRSENHLIWVEKEDGNPDIIRTAIKKLGWEFRSIRGGFVQAKKSNGIWEDIKLSQKVDDISVQLCSRIRLAYSFSVEKIYKNRSEKVEEKKKPGRPRFEKTEDNTEMEQVEMGDYYAKAFLDIKHFAISTELVGKTIAKMARDNYFDCFRDFLVPLAKPAWKLAKRYGRGNWKATRNDFICWAFMDGFCQRTNPLNKHGFKKHDDFGEFPREYTEWQLPFLMICSIARTLTPGCHIEEMLWNGGPEGCYKNKSREWMFPKDMRADCYQEGLELNKNENAVNRKRRGNVLSEFDDNKINHSNFKRYVTMSISKHEEKYEELNTRLKWDDVLVFSSNIVDALPKSEYGNRRIYYVPQYPLEEFTQRIMGEDGEENEIAKKDLDKIVEGKFDEARERLWTEGLALYFMHIKPGMPEGLEKYRLQAAQSASGITRIKNSIRELFLDRMADPSLDRISIAEIAEDLEMNSRDISNYIRDVHLEFGGNGKTTTGRHRGKPERSYKTDKLNPPTEVFERQLEELKTRKQRELDEDKHRNQESQDHLDTLYNRNRRIKTNGIDHDASGWSL